MGAAAVKLRAPYPWFGGKASIAPLIWSRIGDVRNSVEPFFGSGAWTLSRPHWPFDGGENRIETVNDADGFVSNFWRALQHEPECVAKWADWPVNEADLHARHLWLVNSSEVKAMLGTLREDPDAYDCKIAGWWVWGCCQWIGSGWCHHPEWQQLPHLGDAGMAAPWQRGYGHPSTEPETPSILPVNGDLFAYLGALAERMRRVRVCCGDWSRVLGPTPTVKQGLTGVFLDPPYNDAADRKDGLYAIDDLSLSNAVREWCKEWGGDKRMRICLAGYVGEGHEELEDIGWDVVEWKARGGYGSQGDGETNGRENAKKERLWFSPHCLKPSRRQQRSMFGDDST